MKICKFDNLSNLALSINSIGTSKTPANNKIKLYPNIFQAVIKVTKRITNPFVFNQNGDSTPKSSYIFDIGPTIGLKTHKNINDPTTNEIILGKNIITL